MKTTKEGRAKMRKFAALKALHSNRAFNPRYALDLIADVDDAARLLERTKEALKYGGACTCIEADIDEPIPPCPRCELQPLVATFLKEPSG